MYSFKKFFLFIGYFGCEKKQQVNNTSSPTKQFKKTNNDVLIAKIRHDKVRFIMSKKKVKQGLKEFHNQNDTTGETVTKIDKIRITQKNSNYYLIGDGEVDNGGSLKIGVQLDERKIGQSQTIVGDLNSGSDPILVGISCKLEQCCANCDVRYKGGDLTCVCLNLKKGPQFDDTNTPGVCDAPGTMECNEGAVVGGGPNDGLGAILL